MNYNDVRSHAESMIRKAQKLEVVTADVVQRAEMALQIMGHPGWEMFLKWLQEQHATAQRDYEGHKERLATRVQRHDDYVANQLAAVEANSRMLTYKQCAEYLPALIKQGVG